MRINRGLIFVSDTRTNAGVDDFSTTRKMFTWTVPGERKITILTAGNLATTQAMISLLEERSKSAEDRDPSILHKTTMFQVAQLVGKTLKETILANSGIGQLSQDMFRASVIVGGQISGGQPTIFLVYPEGNFIEITDDSPFVQIGETKYGKPILVRAYDPEMDFSHALKLLLVSFDSTIKANLGVGLPFDVEVYENDSFSSDRRTRIEASDELFQSISLKWSEALRDAFTQVPTYPI
jgi:putative proteasome-type protease